MTELAVQDARGAPVELGEELGAGGEGSVFAVRGRPDLCAKIYRPDRATARADKLRTMLARRPPWLLRGALAWPLATLYAQGSGAFVGFVMPARRGMLELFRLLVPDERMQIAGWLTQRDLCTLAARLARVVAGIHRAGHVIGDLKPQNILVAPRTGRVAIIDTDSFQISDPRARRTHRSIVVTPEYTAPELLGRDLAAVDRTPAADLFALAVLIHQLLLGGAHPFAGELAPGQAGGSVERIPGRIRRGLCPRVPGVTAVRPAAGALPFELLPAELRALFVRCFGPGHARPGERPTAREWQQALQRAAAALVTCPESHVHTYAPGPARCPWCERRERTGLDLFPAGQGWQRRLATRSDLAAAPERERLGWLRRHVRGRMVAGSVTAAERAWLEKAGAAIGLDRARVARTIDEQASKRRYVAWVARVARRGVDLVMPRRPARLGLALVAGSCAALGLFAAGTLAAPALRPLTEPALPALAAPVTPDPMLASARTARIGNADGAVFLRAAPSRSSERQRLRPGTPVRLTGRVTRDDGLDWSEVEAPGRRGWVASRYLVHDEP